MADHLTKSGIAVLVGRSNVGKSTLLNTLVGTKIAITTPKPQTTRNVIQGVLNEDRGQVVFADTPGIFTRVPDLLTSKLNAKAKDSMEGIDVLLYVVDATRHVGDEETAIHRLVKQADCPKILVLNKSTLKRPFLDEFMAWKDDFDQVVDIDALEQKNIKELKDAIFSHLKDGVLLYPLDQISNMSDSFRLAELIREKVFLGMHEEVPYSVTVEIDEAVVRPNGVLYVKAGILTTSARYRKMLIGAGAHTVRGVSRAVRKELEAVTGNKAYIELEVRVDEKWQERFE